MKKKYSVKQPSEKTLKKYQNLIENLQTEYHMKIIELERLMEKETKVKGIEFFYSDGYVGIGNADRTMKLWHFK